VNFFIKIEIIFKPYIFYGATVLLCIYKNKKMEVKIEKQMEVLRETSVPSTIKLNNPGALDHKIGHRVKSIEFSEEYTRIDFIYRSSMDYQNGGWIQMDGNAYIQPVGSTTKCRLIRAIGIPIEPLKYYFKHQGEYHSYSLIFPALPSGTTKIDIIEKEAPGTYFNFYAIDYSKWITVPHPMDISQSNN